MPAQTKIFISKLSIPGKANDELSYVFADRVGPDEDALVIFGIFHFLDTSEVYHSLIKETVKNFVDFFHRSKLSPGTHFDDNVDSSEFIFENAIQYTSDRVTQFILSEHESGLRAKSFDIRRTSLALGAIFSDSLYLSMTGSAITPFYIYPVFRKEGFSHYSILNIGADERSSTDSQRLFSSVLSGKLSIQGSTLVICNNHFLDYISIDQIKQAVTNMSIQNLAGYFEGLLGKVHGKSDFSALFVNPHYIGPIPKEIREKASSATNRSMAGLNSTASGTTTILSPSLFTHVKPLIAKAGQWIVAGVMALGRLLKKGAAALVSEIRKMIREKRIDPKAIGILITRGSSALSGAVAGFLVFMKKLSAPKSRSALFRVTTLGLREQIARIRESSLSSLQSLNRTSRAILILGVIFLFLFAKSVISIRSNQIAEKNRRVFQESARTIQLKVDLAEASLLYDNDGKAAVILAEASELLNALPREKNDQQERYAILASRLNMIRAKISKAVIVENPTVFAALEGQLPSASSTVRLVHTGSALLAYTDEELYTIDKAGFARLVDTQAKLSSIRCASPLNTRYVYVCTGDANKLGLIDLKEKTAKTVSVDFHDNEKSIQSIEMYNKKLYVLDPASNMVYRHQLNEDGFGKGFAWIKDASDLSLARDFALDGTIYVLASPVAVLKFDGGKRESFTLPAIDPPLSDAARVWASDESPALLLLEAAQKRIIVIDKKSMRLKSQLVSDTFSDLRDVAATKKDIFVLNGDSVYKLPMP